MTSDVGVNGGRNLVIAELSGKIGKGLKVGRMRSVVRSLVCRGCDVGRRSQACQAAPFLRCGLFACWVDRKVDVRMMMVSAGSWKDRKSTARVQS
jgi:hypothetical protein